MLFWGLKWIKRIRSFCTILAHVSCFARSYFRIDEFDILLLLRLKFGKEVKVLKIKKGSRNEAKILQKLLLLNETSIFDSRKQII